MRRNKEWARQLLTILAESDEGGGVGLFRSELRQLFEDSASSLGMGAQELEDAVDYHLHLLETAGFVKFDPDEENSLDDTFMLTWSGHDYLDSVQ